LVDGDDDRGAGDDRPDKRRKQVPDTVLGSRDLAEGGQSELARDDEETEHDRKDDRNEQPSVDLDQQAHPVPTPRGPRFETIARG